MVFSSTVFLFLFLPITVLLYYCPLVKSRKLKNIILLIVSLLFYAWGEPLFVFLMLFSIVINYFLGIKVSKENKNRKKYLILAYVYNLY